MAEDRDTASVPAGPRDGSLFGLQASSRVELELGQVLAGRYRLTGRLGQGGMGVVHEAYDIELNVALAIKIIRPELARSEPMLRRFKREVLLARSVTHRQVCRIYDFGCHVDESGRTHFITMELLRGESLHARIEAHNRLTTEQVMPLVRDMAMGLAAAHRSGVVHSDFKSGNVMLVEGGIGERAVITDFGLAQLANPAPDATASTTTPLGTPAYMAPEQVRGEPAAPAADIYALGVVLFEMVTGSLPFQESSPGETARIRLSKEPPSPRSRFPELDQRWEEVILRCLARAPEDRYSRVEDVVAALEGGDEVSVARLHALPGERNRFVGREHDRRAIHRHLESARLLTLVGPGGIGKTRLAVNYGSFASSSFTGGVWFCDLTDASSMDGIAATVASSLELSLERGDPIADIGHAIRGRGCALLILDNFEQVAEHADATLGRWLELAPEAQILVTSRERLHLEGEVVLELEPLTTNEGVELFADRVRGVRPGFILDAETASPVQEVVNLLEGHPLAIELAAARASVMPLATIVERLQDRFRLLARRRDGGRHDSLRAAIDGSWEMLTPWEKTAFAQVSVFEGGFTLEAAEAVIDLEAHPRAPWVVDVLQALVDKSLIRTWVPEGAWGNPRFGMYVSLQEYAHDKLGADDPGQPDTAQLRAEERHGQHYARFGAEEAREALLIHDGVARRKTLERELDNLVVATRRAVARCDGATAALGFGATWEILELKGPVSAVIDIGETVAGIGDLDHGMLSRVLRDLGRACWRAGFIEQSRNHYELSLEIATRLSDRRFEGIVVEDLAMLLVSIRDAKGAGECCERALAIHREVQNRVHEGIVIGSLGIQAGQEGRIADAGELFESALAVHREVGNRLFEGIVLGNLGTVHGEQGRATEARHCFEKALEIYRELGARRAEGTTLANIGILHHLADRDDLARTQFERALAIHRAVGSRHGEGLVLGYLGAHHSGAGNLPEARKRFMQSVVCLREVHEVIELGTALCELGDIEVRSSDLEAARRYFAEAEELAITSAAPPHSEFGQALKKLAERLGETSSVPTVKSTP